MSNVICKFLSNEERAANIIIGGGAVVAGVCFLAAVCAIVFMR